MEKIYTSIQLTKETADKLKSFGNKGETYEEVIKKMIEIAEKGAKK